jgi:mono/diheme cytochrome c family protein
MPDFRWLPEEELESVVDYVIMLSQRGELERRLAVEAADLNDDESLDPLVVADFVVETKDSWRDAVEQLVLPETRMPAMSEETIAAGREAFLTRGCAKCHGEDGRGQTQENVGKDAWGNTTFAADLTSGMLHGGRRPIDVYRRIYSGINGTPMPAFSGALAEEPDTIWHLVHFVLAVADGQAVDVAATANGEG